MFIYIPTREIGHLRCSIHKKSGLKLSKYKADTFDMIQNAFEENNKDKAIVYTWAKRKKVCNGECCWQNEEMCEQEKSIKTPQTVNTIYCFSDQSFLVNDF